MGGSVLLGKCNNRNMNKPEQIFSNSDEVYDEIERLLDLLPHELKGRWQHEVENLEPSDAVAKLEEIVAKRTSVMTHGSVHYSAEAEHDPVLYEGLKRVVAGLESSHGDPTLFLGDGNVAEVYRVNYEPRICIKSVVNEEAYQNGNTIYQEGDFLEKLNFLEVDGVRTPKFYFYHDTQRLRSLGMETIEGASLSKIVTGAVDFQNIKDINVDEYYASMKRYIEAMHEQNIFHGDLFERNIMIDKATLKPRIIDFGKSKLAYFDQDIGGYREGDFELLKRSKHSLERFLKGEKVDLN